jgi:spore photoproduct lyase
MIKMKFDLDAVFIERGCADSALAARIIRSIPAGVPVHHVADAREAAKPAHDARDPLGAGKRRMIIARRKTPFLMACPAGSSKFACCGYLVLTLASNCPMDCSYCFLQEYLADNPAFQLYANFADSFEELDRLVQSAPGRSFRVGTGELADSLAFDSITGISRELVEFFAARENLTLELKTKTDEIGNLIGLDPRGRVLVSWTLSSDNVYRSSEHRTASPAARIAAARAVLEAGYRVAFHFDPLIAYPGAERDYVRLIDELLDNVPAKKISFISMGGLRMTPSLRSIARRRFSADPMLCGEDVLASDGRFRTFTPLRLKLYRTLAEQFRKAGAEIPAYLCMEPASIHERVFGETPPRPARIGERLASSREPGFIQMASR